MSHKKHPLEIFKMHGAFDKSETKKKPSPNRNKKKNGMLGRPKKGVKQGNGVGDKVVSFSLNGVLFFLFAVVTISVGAYFIGYQKGVKSGNGLKMEELKSEKQRVGYEGDESQDIDNNEVASSGGSKRWGVQVGTWDQRSLKIAEATHNWLLKKNYKSKLWPLKGSTKYCIIVGSFLDPKDEELEQLKLSLQAIDDFDLGGDSDPFKDAVIRGFEVAKRKS